MYVFSFLTVLFDITNTASTSVNLMLNCDLSEQRGGIFMIADGTAALDIQISCNSTEAVGSLKPSTNYSVKAVIKDGTEICLLQHFETKQAGEYNNIIVACFDLRNYVEYSMHTRSRIPYCFSPCRLQQGTNCNLYCRQHITTTTTTSRNCSLCNSEELQQLYLC